MKWLRSAARTGCAALVASAMAVVLGASPANAGAVIADGFEPATAADWNLWAGGPELCFAPQYGNDPICEVPGRARISPTTSNAPAHSGNNYLFMMNAGEYANYTVADRYVDLPVHATCSASIFVKPVWFAYDMPIRAKIEIIDPGPWEKINKETFELYRDNMGWQQYTVTWSGGPRSVVVRLFLRGSTNYVDVAMYADDLEVSCSRPSSKP
jgi:hypothetical protein